MKTYKLAEAELKIEQLEKEAKELTWESNNSIANLVRETIELKKTIEGFRKGYYDLNDYSDKIKTKLANQKYLDRQEVEKILHDKLSTNYKTLIIDICGVDEAVTAICNLALKIDRDKIIEALKPYLQFREDTMVWGFNDAAIGAVADEIISAIGGK